LGKPGKLYHMLGIPHYIFPFKTQLMTEELHLTVFVSVNDQGIPQPGLNQVISQSALARVRRTGQQ
jgi:hypothetical protein